MVNRIVRAARHRGPRAILDVLLIALCVAVLLGLGFVRLAPALGASSFVITGPSMAPTISVGAVVVAVPVSPDELAVGDVVSIRTGAGRAVYTHRIVRISQRTDGRWIETQGDANATADPALIPAGSVVGRVGIVVPLLGFVVALLSVPSGIICVVALAAGLITMSRLVDTEDREEPDARTSVVRGEPVVAAR